MNNMYITISREQLVLRETEREIRLYKLDDFDHEQVKNYKNFVYDSLIVQADYITLSIDKKKYTIRFYPNYISFRYKG